ncbi:MAG TPA: hypothetical protein VF178_07950 [Gemmatimonadaceae bacterium]
MSIVYRLLLVIVLTAPLLGARCVAMFGPDERGCTLIGCESGLWVHLSSLPAAPFTVEVIVPGKEPGVGVPSYVYTCDVGEPCSSDIFFPGLAIEDPIVRVTSAAGTFEIRFQEVEYPAHHPNTHRCPPRCHIGHVTVDVPS